MSEVDNTGVIRRFVRGESSWTVLEDLGARMTFRPQGLELDEPGDAPVYEASAVDVATGFIRHFGRETLREWARVMLATGMIDLSSLETHPRGDVLLAVIWDAAGAEPVAAHRLSVVRELAER